MTTIDPDVVDVDEQSVPPPVESSELVHRDGAVGSVLPDLDVIPAQHEMRSIAQLANTLAAAHACPSALRGKPNDVFLVLLSARDLGVSLTTAMREFHVIEGKVTLSPKVKLALVRQAGIGAIWPAAENDALAATWHATRRDLPEHTVTSTYTWAEAQLAHLVDSRCTPTEHWRGEGRGSGRNSADCLCKSNWKTYPARMLSWRAVGYLLDDLFPEVGTGLYSPDELGAVTDEHGEPIEVRAVESLPGMRGGAQRAAVVEVADAETIDELQTRLAVVKRCEPAHVELRDWWHERELPKVSELPASSARLVVAKLDAVERTYADELAALAGDVESDEQTRDTPEAPADAQGDAQTSIPLAECESPPDGDVAGWLIERAKAMTAAELRADYRLHSVEPPQGNVALLRRLWTLWTFERYGRGLLRALTCFAYDDAQLSELVSLDES